MSYQALSLSGAGYASIADGSQQGLNFGLSDFMIEGWLKTTNTAQQYIVFKSGAGGYYYFQMSGSQQLKSNIYDGTILRSIASTDTVNDGRWHYGVIVFDRSGNGQIFLDGSVNGSAVDITAVGDIDNDGDLFVGQHSGGSSKWTGLFDEWRIWNFGYGGLPGDFATYITWRATGRNRFLDISEYNGGAWNGYADALRTERMTLGDLDDDNGDFESAGADGTDIETGTDWTKVNTSAEIDNQAGSGVNSYNGSDFCCKIHTATDNYPNIFLSGANFESALVAGDYYEVSFDYKVLNSVDAIGKIWANGAETQIIIPITSTSWTTLRQTFTIPNLTDVKIQFYSHRSITETGNEVLWVDNVSIKRIGLVARYKFDGTYDDETANTNHLTEGGSNNVFPGYTLKKNKIIAPDWVR